MDVARDEASLCSATLSGGPGKGRVTSCILPADTAGVGGATAEGVEAEDWWMRSLQRGTSAAARCAKRRDGNAEETILTDDHTSNLVTVFGWKETMGSIDVIFCSWGYRAQFYGNIQAFLCYKMFHRMM